MIKRQEASGVHYYDRHSGLHILHDEVTVPADIARLCGPRHLSVVLTRRCNLHCRYCYVSKSATDLTLPLLRAICDAAHELDVLDLTFGGGEPTLHPSFIEFVRFAWNNYPFGISVTTNGTDIPSLLALRGTLSSIRVSIDAFDRRLHEQSIESLRQLRPVHHVGINLLCSPRMTTWASETIERLTALGITDILLIPEHKDGTYILETSDWDDLNALIQNCHSKVRLLLTADAARRVLVPILPNAHPREYLFANIDESGNVRTRSWSTPISSATDKDAIILALRKLNPLTHTAT